MLRRMYAALMEDAHDDAMLCMQVGVRLAANMPRAQVARELELDAKEIERIVERLRAIAQRIDRDDPFALEF